eukprot:TRINITY_DN4760_c0_g2_i10.p1 TRINITY_DN4760_c0_g2~~TRINITY_DN4760_c0_g2_i10.p1  ORF type:complete len:131 (+),score=8.38 TRINITY_DN4760_c0_g2_i10:234-626(+)
MLYGPNSMLTYDGAQFMGAAQINEKLASLPKLTHKITTADIQPTLNGVLCFVNGQLMIDESGNPLMFSQVFHVVPSENGGYYCKRCSYGRSQRYLQTELGISVGLIFTLQLLSIIGGILSIIWTHIISHL